MDSQGKQSNMYSDFLSHEQSAFLMTETSVIDDDHQAILDWGILDCYIVCGLQCTVVKVENILIVTIITSHTMARESSDWFVLGNNFAKQANSF